METPNTASTSPNAEVQSWFKKNRLAIAIAALFIVSNLGIYLYQRFQMGKLRDAVNLEMENKSNLAAQFAQYSNERLADALVKPLVWGIRGEMMRGNKEIVDHFIKSAVQESDLKLIAIVDMTGMVYLSTDKEYENKPVVSVIPTMPKHVLGVGIQAANMDKVIGTAPILGETEQLGVLYFEAVRSDSGSALLKALRANPFAEPEEE